MRRNGVQGFTLIEIAIVLIIIGLLLGGLLKGRELIAQARVKNIINDFSGVATAYHAYRDRYRALPGDDAAAASRWGLGAAGTSATAGNGALEGLWNDGTAAIEPETRLFWWHLRAAGLLVGPTAPAPQAAAQPTNAVGGLIGAATGTGAPTLGLSGPMVCASGVPDKIAIAVDTQSDDQHAGTGSLRAIIGGSATPLGPLSSPPADYAETGAHYLLCRGL